MNQSSAHLHDPKRAGPTHPTLRRRNIRRVPNASSRPQPTIGKDTLLERAAQPKEIAPIFVLLASDEASYITGMIYGATGGKPLL